MFDKVIGDGNLSDSDSLEEEMQDILNDQSNLSTKDSKFVNQKIETDSPFNTNHLFAEKNVKNMFNIDDPELELSDHTIEEVSSEVEEDSPIRRYKSVKKIIVPIPKNNFRLSIDPSQPKSSLLPTNKMAIKHHFNKEIQNKKGEKPCNNCMNCLN